MGTTAETTKLKIMPAETKKPMSRSEIRSLSRYKDQNDAFKNAPVNQPFLFEAFDDSYLAKLQDGAYVRYYFLTKDRKTIEYSYVKIQREPKYI